MEKIVLCGKPDGGCCPEVLLSKQNIVITDDEGNTVTLTYEQFEILKQKVEGHKK